MIDAQNFCHIEQVKPGVNVLFYADYDGDEATLHQVTVLTVGTMDIKVTMTADTFDRLWPENFRFATAAAEVLAVAAEMGFGPQEGTASQPAPASHSEGGQGYFQVTPASLPSGLLSQEPEPSRVEYAETPDPATNLAVLTISAAEARALLHGMPDHDFSVALTRIANWLADYDEMPTPPGNQIRTAECDGEDAVPVTGQLPVGTASPGFEQFEEYFVKNYPGPDTVIFDPKWHAPKIYRAALVAYLAAATGGSDNG